MTHYWLTCWKFTVRVAVVGGCITEAAPIVRRFKGQPLKRLVEWMKSLGGFEMVEMGGGAC